MSTSTVVVDTSVIVKWLSQDNEDHLEQADNLLRDLQKGKATLVAPELAKYEVGNVLLRGKNLSYDEANIVLAHFYGLPITFIEDDETLATLTFEIAGSTGVTYYDASFMALAKLYDATLVTDNVKHQGRSREIQVRALKEY